MRIVYQTCMIAAFVALIAFNASGQVPATAPSSPQPTPTPTPSLEKKFIVNILRDQRAIWTSPLHLSRADAVWLAPLGVATASLIASDRATTAELVEHGDNQTRLDISNAISKLGAGYTTIGIAATFYVVGRVENNSRARETGLLGGRGVDRRSNRYLGAQSGYESATAARRSGTWRFP